MRIKFFFTGTTLKLPERLKLRGFISKLFNLEKKTFTSLSYIFCSDEYLHAINKEFLSHDNYTDIITFCLSDADKPIVGEIYISVERIIDNSSALGILFYTELHRVIFHGALHLCGYKDTTKAEKNRMTLTEDKYLKMYFI